MQLLQNFTVIVFQTGWCFMGFEESVTYAYIVLGNTGHDGNAEGSVGQGHAQGHSKNYSWRQLMFSALLVLLETIRMLLVLKLCQTTRILL